MRQQIIIPPGVKQEVIDKGKQVGGPEAGLIEQAMSEGWISQVNLSDRERGVALQLRQGTRLAQGEVDSLAVARVRTLEVLLDDKEARAMAEALGLRYLGTIGLLFEAYVSGRREYKKLEEALAKASRVLWLSADIVTELLIRAREVKE